MQWNGNAMQRNEIKLNEMPIDEQNKILHRYRRSPANRHHRKNTSRPKILDLSFLRWPVIVRIQIDI